MDTHEKEHTNQGSPQLTGRAVTGTRTTPRRHTRNLQQSLELKPVVSGLFLNNYPVHPARLPFHRNVPQIGASLTEAERQGPAAWDQGFGLGKGPDFGQCGAVWGSQAGPRMGKAFW